MAARFVVLTALSVAGCNHVFGIDPIGLPDAVGCSGERFTAAETLFDRGTGSSLGLAVRDDELELFYYEASSPRHIVWATRPSVADPFVETRFPHAADGFDIDFSLILGGSRLLLVSNRSGTGLVYDSKRSGSTFEPPLLIAIGVPRDIESAWMSPDGLRIYVVLGDASPSLRDIAVAERPKVDAPFGPPRLVAMAEAVTQISLSADELELYFNAPLDLLPGGSNTGIRKRTRATTTAWFDAAEEAVVAGASFPSVSEGSKSLSYLTSNGPAANQVQIMRRSCP